MVGFLRNEWKYRTMPKIDTRLCDNRYNPPPSIFKSSCIESLSMGFNSAKSRLPVRINSLKFAMFGIEAERSEIAAKMEELGRQHVSHLSEQYPDFDMHYAALDYY